MNFYVYKLGVGHSGYMEWSGARRDLRLLFSNGPEARTEAAQKAATQESCMRHFLAYETRSQVAKVIYQAVPCRDDVVIGFVEEAPEGWAAMYLSSPVPLVHLEVAWFSTLTLHPSDELEIRHRDGQSRPVISVQQAGVGCTNSSMHDCSRRRRIV